MIWTIGVFWIWNRESGRHGKRQAAQDAFGPVLKKKHYFTGISDLSDCGLSSDAVSETFFENAPLCGEIYRIDLDGIRRLGIPSLLLGPWGKDIHRRTGRVNRKSLTEEPPYLVCKLIEQVFANQADL